MKIEQQVISLEQAKKLKELGVRGVPMFLHIDNTILGNEGIKRYSKNTWPADGGVIRYYAAYTASELIVIMPNHSHIGDWYMRYCWKGISFGYDGKNVGKDHIEEPWYKPEQAAEALAFLLIYLLENNLTTPSEVNERLK